MVSMDRVASRNDEFSHHVPILCSQSPEPIRRQFPKFLVIHYMDDVLFSAPSVLETHHMFDTAQQCLKDSGLIIAPEKIPTSTRYHYLR